VAGGSRHRGPVDIGREAGFAEHAKIDQKGFAAPLFDACLNECEIFGFGIESTDQDDSLSHGCISDHQSSAVNV
jgi:hypothetical protein